MAIGNRVNRLISRGTERRGVAITDRFIGPSRHERATILPQEELHVANVILLKDPEVESLDAHPKPGGRERQ